MPPLGHPIFIPHDKGYFRINISPGNFMILHSLHISFLSFFLTFSAQLNSPHLFDSMILNEGIVVRESTIDLQIRVGHKLYVFGKTSGNLEKVKIGMHVLEISQSKEIPGLASKLKKVEWKKQKDGSVTISSQYDPWPNSLVWSVSSNGELKLHISGSAALEKDLAGLGFFIPEHDLQEVRINDQLIRQGFSDSLSTSYATDKAQIDFSEVKLLVKSDAKGFQFMTKNLTVANDTADLFFYFPQLSSTGSKSSNSDSPSNSSTTLWFDFQ